MIYSKDNIMRTYNKLILLFLLIFMTTISYAQTHRYYCEITGTYRDFADEMKIVFDFGDCFVYNTWGGLNSDMVFVDNKGETIYFNSMIDAMNFMSEKGWQLHLTYSSILKNGKVAEHWILYKDAENREKAREGIMTKDLYKLKAEQERVNNL
mgnify:FL=1